MLKWPHVATLSQVTCLCKHNFLCCIFFSGGGGWGAEAYQLALISNVNLSCRGKTDYVNEDVSSVLKPPATNVQKRFTVPRFASKDDSRRRVVPVYCASNEESEMVRFTLKSF